MLCLVLFFHMFFFFFFELRMCLFSNKKNEKKKECVCLIAIGLLLLQYLSSKSGMVKNYFQVF